ncbi:MAG: flagellar protein FlaG [Candidatus Azotimanducaceae bacterium]|jgi:flagellar protein FlaG
MNNINPQSPAQAEQRSGTRGGQRTEASTIPAVSSGNELPLAEATDVTATAAAKAVESKEQLVKAVAKLNDYIQSVQRDLRFTLDETSGRSVITVIDTQSNEVIRRIPEEITLSLAQKLNNEEPLLLFSAQV